MKALPLIAIVGLLAGCSKPKDTPADSHSGMTVDSGMTGMLATGNSQMMPMMQAHTDSMTRMNPEQMSGMMARHERMMSQMMDQMGSDMRQMKMPETGEWSALSDSIRQDLAELPSLKGQPLSTRMRAHTGRVQRLLSSHEQMMKGMH